MRWNWKYKKSASRLRCLRKAEGQRAGECPCKENCQIKGRSLRVCSSCPLTFLITSFRCCVKLQKIYRSQKFQPSPQSPSLIEAHEISRPERRLKPRGPTYLLSSVKLLPFFRMTWDLHRRSGSCRAGWLWASKTVFNWNIESVQMCFFN